MCAILLFFVVSFNLVSSDVANVQQLLERVDLLELKLATLSNAYESLLEDRSVQNQCNCSDLEEDIRDIGIIAAKNRHNILVNNDMIQKNEDKIEANEESIQDGIWELTALIQTNEDDIEEKVQSITADLEVRQVHNQFCYVCKYMIFCYFRS